MGLVFFFSVSRNFYNFFHCHNFYIHFTVLLQNKFLDFRTSQSIIKLGGKMGFVYRKNYNFFNSFIKLQEAKWLLLSLLGPGLH